MDREQRKKINKIQVICAEIVMVISVIAIVVVASLLSMGYTLNQDGDVEQSGLLQVYSSPTGATVDIDGETTFYYRTNLSRSLSPTSHQITLTKDGYESWSKSISLTAGRLTRVYYPHLILQDRETRTVASTSSSFAFLSASPSYQYLLTAPSHSTSWTLVDIRGDEPKTTTIDLSKFLDSSAEVSSIDWSKSAETILISFEENDASDYLLLNLNSPDKSQLLSKLYPNYQFEQVSFLSNSGDQLFALDTSHNLRKLTPSGAEISDPLLEKIDYFLNSGENLAFVTLSDKTLAQLQSSGAAASAEETALIDSLSSDRIMGTYRDGDAGGVTIETLTDPDVLSIPVLSDYYGETYLTYTLNNHLQIFHGTLPSYSEAWADSAMSNAKLADHYLTSTPTCVSTDPSNEFVLFRQGSTYNAVDLDSGNFFTFESAETPTWLADGMLARLRSSDQRRQGATDLIISDFDGQNSYDFATTADSLPSSSLISYAVISSNSKYLYYLDTDSAATSDSASANIVLKRQQILK